jgi:hypothetical protein
MERFVEELDLDFAFFRCCGDEDLLPFGCPDNSKPINTAMMEMTTSNSMSVKASRRRIANSRTSPGLSNCFKMMPTSMRPLLDAEHLGQMEMMPGCSPQLR